MVNVFASLLNKEMLGLIDLCMFGNKLIAGFTNSFVVILDCFDHPRNP